MVRLGILNTQETRKTEVAAEMMKSAVIFMRFCRAFEKGSSWNNTKRQKKRNNYVVVKRKEK